jgi:hypothetical protein
MCVHARVVLVLYPQQSVRMSAVFTGKRGERRKVLPGEGPYVVAVASVVDLAAAEVAVAHRRDIRIEIPNMPVVVAGHICLLTVVPVWNQ